jgi:ABC-type nickel/cobalt efflux system permease component RcnA
MVEAGIHFLFWFLFWQALYRNDARRHFEHEQNQNTSRIEKMTSQHDETAAKIILGRGKACDNSEKSLPHCSHSRQHGPDKKNPDKQFSAVLPNR